MFSKYTNSKHAIPVRGKTHILLVLVVVNPASFDSIFCQRGKARIDLALFFVSMFDMM